MNNIDFIMSKIAHPKGSLKMYEESNVDIEMYNKTIYDERNSVIINMLKEIKTPLNIFEFAASYGFLALKIYDNILFNTYTASNFLLEAVEYMRHQIGDKGIDVQLIDANNITNVHQYNVFICTSFEHLEYDYKIIDSLPKGCIFIFSVPNFYDSTHFRVFPYEKAIKDRYNKVLNINQIVTIRDKHLRKFIVISNKV